MRKDSVVVVPKIIGVSGVARVGKDTLCDFLEQDLKEKQIKTKRLAFAKFLKDDLDDFLLAKVGISAYSNNTEEKTIIRPVLVEYGKMMRNISEGMYWIDKLKSSMPQNNSTICLISDVRYPNEAEWINDINGITIHISREGIEPANEEEAINDPQTKKLCQFKFQPVNTKTSQLPHSYLPIINEILNRKNFRQQINKTTSSQPL